MRQRNGYGLAGTPALTRAIERHSLSLRHHGRPVTARGRQVLEASRRRLPVSRVLV